MLLSYCLPRIKQAIKHYLTNVICKLTIKIILNPMIVTLKAMY